MIFLSFLLHIYQPPTQFPEITKRISKDSYQLIFKILDKTKGRITLNIPASLTEQFKAYGEDKIISDILRLVKKKQIELTATGAYHPLLPRLEEGFMQRQIILNSSINKKIFGENIYCPKGLFPPEMAYSSDLGRVLNDLNFEWVILEELAYKYTVGKIKHDRIYIKKETNTTKDITDTKNKELKIFFRDMQLSNAIALSQVRTLRDFDRLLNSKRKEKDEYFIIALDGETFGHHQQGQDKLLYDILNYKKYNIVLISELGKYFRTKEHIIPLTSCWGASVNELRKKIYWPRWSYPGNKIHDLQWQLTKLALEVNRRLKSNKTSLFDKALHSDQYWWASRKPYWHPEMIRRGGQMLLDCIKENHASSVFQKNKAQVIYNDILEEIKKVGERIIV